MLTRKSKNGWIMYTLYYFVYLKCTTKGKCLKDEYVNKKKPHKIFFSNSPITQHELEYT